MTGRIIGGAFLTMLFTLVAAFLCIESVLAIVAGSYTLAVLLWVVSWAYSVFAARFCLLALDEWLTRHENRGESH